MAKTRARMQSKPKSSLKKKKKRGPDSSSDVRKTKSMDEVLGIEPINFSDEEIEAEHVERHLQPANSSEEVSPRAVMKEHQQREEIRLKFAQVMEAKKFMEAHRQTASAISQGKNVTPPILRSGNIMQNLDCKFADSAAKQKIKITMEDIEDEVDYWKSSMVCYVLGANPPLSILEGFARRVWKDKVEKVGMLSYGIFLIRFDSVEDRDQVILGGYIFFNKRPVIMKAWDPNVNFKKQDIQSVPIWVQLDDLELKYWGEKSLFKIISQVGKPLMVNSITKIRDKLSYPRVLIEVSLKQAFPDLIWFEDEHGFNTSVAVTYEWKPIICDHCKGMGHDSSACRRKEGRKPEWVVKNTEKPTGSGEKTLDSNKDMTSSLNTKAGPNGFKPATKVWKVKAKDPLVNTSVANSFQALIESNGGDLKEGEQLLFPMDKIISWNVRGINSQQKQRLVKQFIATQRVGLVGLLKTRVKAQKLGALYLNLFTGWCFTSNNAWHSGGRIVVSWNPSSFNVNIIKCTSQLIHLGVATVDNKNFFFVTYVYAFNDEEGRKRLWKDLQDLSVMGPWIVMGDFNDILAKEERIGNRVRYKTSTDFTDCVANCQLEDVKYSGSFYTWCNKQHGEDRIYSKIDRVLANEVWLSLFPDVEIVFLNEGLFDHTPAVLTVYSNVPCGRKPFKYFNMWSTHPEYFDKVKVIWQQQVTGKKMYRIITKLKALKAVFKEINAQGYSDITSAEIQARDHLVECQDKLQREPLNPVIHVMELEARNRYAKVHKDYFSFLQQKSKLNWARNGDENSTLFHISIQERRRHNRILSIVNSKGDRVDELIQVIEAFLSY
ncbi:uncharacterized protein LOC133817249 [Humulus lupulus]|uniref:uncharacterized protein LOC133817249 n=1 Tax=Humulus lupulus TaxID=3486 RepID=UPI002B401678|nr:uncharacterized protein LOC133817249 [Humulus lupulus]